MALPGVTLNVLDGNLNLQPGSNEHTVMYLGCSTLGSPDVLVSYGDSTTMQTAQDAGALVEAAGYGLNVGGGPIQLMALTPSVVGAYGSVTHTGTGTATVSLSSGPHKAIVVTIVTGGALGTATATFKIGTAAASAPVTLPTGHDYLIPGSYCVASFPTGTYVTADTFTVATSGTVTHVGTGTALMTQASSPIDDYQALITVTTGGALGTGQFTYSLDNGTTTSPAIVTAGSGVYAIPGSGIVLTFSTSVTLGDTYTFKTAGPTFASGDLTAALTALEGTYLSSIRSSLIYVMGGSALGTAWESQSAALETAALALFNAGVYVRFINECPTTGSISSNAGVLTVDSTDTDSVVITDRQSVSAAHVITGAGDMLLTNPVSGLALRRNAAFAAVARFAKFEASRNIGDVSAGGVPGIISLYRDETKVPGLDAAGFTTLRTFPGLPGFFFTDSHTMSVTTSDYYPATNARVIDQACGVALVNALPLVQSKIPTTTRNGVSGVITEKKAQQIEGRISSALNTVLVDTDPADAVAVGVTVNRTHNILSDGNLIIAIAVQPFGYARTVTVNIGMSVSA